MRPLGKSNMMGSPEHMTVHVKALPIAYTRTMGFIKKAATIPDTVANTGEKINAGIDTATIYLVIVGTVAVTALIVAAIALRNTNAR